MNNFSIADAMKFVRENDVKFIKLAFCDIFGELKNISIMASELAKAFDTGIPFDASAIQGFMNIEESDLFLAPDPATMSVLPWRSAEGCVIRFFCDIKMPDGSPFEGDGRSILKREISKAGQKGYTIKFGTECEFYLFELDENGAPTTKPHDRCGYCDIAPLDKGENVRREICFALEDMGIYPEMSHHEQGPGQHEIDFRYDGALNTADNFVTFKSVVKNIAARNGLHASFLPKPLFNASGSGLHINMSIYKDNKNIFRLSNDLNKGPSASFVEGILSVIEEISLFTNPITNSYERLGENSAPKFISWSEGNRSQLIRIPAAKGSLKRMELRNPDPVCSPYLTFALLINAGMEGISKKLELRPPATINLYTAPSEELTKYKQLPENLNEAINLAKSSNLVKKVIPQDTLNRFIKIKKEEWQDCDKLNDKYKYEMDKYFYRY